MDDLNFHLTATFQTHVQSDGSNIAPGAADPTNCGVVLGVPGHPAGLLVFNDGPKFAAMEAYAHRPLQAGATRLEFSYDVTDYGSFYSDGWVHETDTILVSKGKKYNVSAQRLAKNNMIQISDQTGKWVDSGFVAPPLVPGVPLHHSFVYGFDLTSERYAIETITIGPVEFLVPFALKECTAVATTWADGATGQFQNACGPNGGRIRLLYENVSHRWS